MYKDYENLTYLYQPEYQEYQHIHGLTNYIYRTLNKHAHGILDQYHFDFHNFLFIPKVNATSNYITHQIQGNNILIGP